jgi:hypothetical protein
MDNLKRLGADLSIIDRLIVEEQSYLNQFRAGVRRDLEDLLNTVGRATSIPDYLEELDESIVNFGIADLLTTNVSTQSERDKLILYIKKIIEKYDDGTRRRAACVCCSALRCVHTARPRKGTESSGAAPPTARGAGHSASRVAYRSLTGYSPFGVGLDPRRTRRHIRWYPFAYKLNAFWQTHGLHGLSRGPRRQVRERQGCEGRRV